jgi:hypothetical protein
MTLFNLILAVHILFGFGALLAGVLAMAVRKSRGLHTRLGEAYHWLYVGIALTACALAALQWERLWWFVPIAVGSYAFALLGYAMAKIRPKDWLKYHLIGQGGSYIGIITAVLVVNLGIKAWVPWVLPTLVGTPLIIWISREVQLGRRPKYD